MKTTESDLTITHPAIVVAGRVMFTLIFFLSGVTHFTDRSTYVGLMPAAIPFRAFWVTISGVVELIGAMLVLTNRQLRLGAWLIVLFLVPVTITVHGVAMATTADPQMQAIQTSFFLKGVTMTGAALLITQLGVTPAVAPGPRVEAPRHGPPAVAWSLDNRS
jgi:putative oxidoreductase